MAPAPEGYVWSEPLTKPLPLVAVERGMGAAFGPGNYDFETRPVGDNWALACPGAFTSVKLTKSGNASVLPRFPFDEPSCGFVILKRGPYGDGTPVGNRGAWEMNCLPGGLSFKRASMPVYTHVGARYDRYMNNGYRWLGDGGYPPMDWGFWGGLQPAVGPKKFNTTERVPVLPCATGPDVTILSSIPNVPIWIAYAQVDMRGRETAISDPVKVDISDTPWQGVGTYAVVKREEGAKAGCCGFHVYAGFTLASLHRQPVLDYQGHEARYLWPLWLQQFILHDLRTDTPCPNPSSEVCSLLNWPQQQVAEGHDVIEQVDREYDLYCPFVLHYDPDNFGRVFTGKAKYIHKTEWNGQPLQTDIPLMLYQSQDDHVNDIWLVSDTALAGWSSSDYSGGQAFGGVFTRCGFGLAGPESYGMLVDERCSGAFGGHTASEIRFKECGFAATIPTKIEGNQSAKIRFQEACQFYANGHTRYSADTVGISYQASPNDVHYTQIRGVNGLFRSLFCSCAMTGQANILATDLFCDAGCPVYVTFGSFQGGTVTIRDGERINTPMEVRQWARLVEAPSAIGASVVVRGVRMHPQVSCVSFMLNQLTIDTDWPVGEVVAPTPESWTARTLLLQYPNATDMTNPAYFNFEEKRQRSFNYGFPTAIDTPVPATVLGP